MSTCHLRTMKTAISNPVYCEPDNIAGSSFGSHSESNKSSGMHCSSGRLVLSVLGVAVLVTAVGLMVHYLPPDATCPPEEECEKPGFDTCWDIVQKHNECMILPACNTSAPWPQPPTRPPSSDYLRLPTALKPTHYTVELKPDFYSDNTDDFYMEGNVTITLEVVAITKVITVHIRQINISSASISVTKSTGELLAVESSGPEPELEFYHIHLQQEVEIGDVLGVFMHYTAPLKQDNVGVYYSGYYDEGRYKYMLGTQFEPLDARKAFPCLDEPAMKAKFNISLWRKDGVVALTNMPSYASETSGEWTIDLFEETPVVMPTYLLSFAWADFESVENTSSTGITSKLVRNWGTPEAVRTGQLSYVNQVAVEIFDELENLFNSSFDLPKLDQIAIRQFGAGAMENWGLVTYDDTRLLVHPNYTSFYDQQRLTRTLAHELVHMWFGNKVTCEWWDEIWIQETFARYFEYWGINGRVPFNTSWENIYWAQTWQQALEVDDSGQANPVVASARTIAELEGTFSSIVYDKGSGLIRMMRKFLFDSDDDFINANREYLRDNLYGNTNYNNLLESWGKFTSSGLPVDFKQFLESWILQSTHPVVTISREGDKVTFKQNQFLYDPQRPMDEKYDPKFNYKWVIPATYITKSNSDVSATWLELDDGEVTINGLQPDDWILGNPGQFGFYRVNYDSNNWALLLQQINSDYNEIDVSDRGQLISDSYRLARSGLVSPDLPLNFTKYLANEQKYLPWFSGAKVFSGMNGVIATTDWYGTYREFIRSSVKQNYERLTWTEGPINEDLEQKYLRTLIIELACEFQLEDCITQSTTLFDTWINQGERSARVIDPALRETIACTHMANRGTVADWDNLFQVYAEVRDFHRLERARIRNALACTKDTWILQRYANMALNRDSRLDSADLSAILSQIANNPAGKMIISDMLDQNWNSVPGRTSVLGAVTNHYFTEYDLHKLESFYEAHPPTTSSESSSYEATRYKVKANIRLRNAVLDADIDFS